MKPSPRITESQLQALLDKEWGIMAMAKVTPPPEHWQSLAQIAAKWGVTESIASKRLRTYRDDGTVSTRRFRINSRWSTHFCPTAVLRKLEPTHVSPKAQGRGTHSD